MVSTVLFACIHNAGRSQIAAAFFNQAADPSKASAVSAGTRPAHRLHAEVVEAMKEVGVDLSSARPRRLDVELARGAQLLVTMGCGEECPAVPSLPRVEWPIDDPKGQPAHRVREIRDEIRARVVRLVLERGWTRTA